MVQRGRTSGFRNGRRKVAPSGRLGSRPKATWIKSSATEPPPFSQVPKAMRKFRYFRAMTAVTTDDTPITVREIREALLASAATGTTSIVLIKAFRLLRVDVWLIPASSSSSGNTGSIAFTWAGDHDPNNSIQARPGVAQNAHIATRPAEHSSLAWWMSSNDDAETAFNLSVNGVDDATVMVDLELEYTLEIALATIATHASHSSGVYLTALDSAAATPLYLSDAPAASRIDTVIS